MTKKLTARKDAHTGTWTLSVWVPQRAEYIVHPILFQNPTKMLDWMMDEGRILDGLKSDGVQVVNGDTIYHYRYATERPGSNNVELTIKSYTPNR